MTIPTKLQDEIWDYCRSNKITNIDEFTVKLIKQGFTVEKFGATPTVKEKIIEKIVEIEVIKPLDLKVPENVSTHIKQLEDSRNEFKAEVERLAKELSLREQKNTKKKDIYGE
jgi:hypothetical protein|tara:strand:- start:35362 stop:35700 length:339 start_codon:yes stop_codon:yes gene_type:complete